MRQLLPALITLCMLVSGFVHAQAIYKITDPDGKVRYSDTKPDNAGDAAVDTITLPAEQNVIKADPQMQLWLEQKQRNAQEAARNETRALSGWEAEYEAAKANLKRAEDALAAGKDPKEGDFIGISNRFGGSAGARPSEEFLERVQQLEKDVAAARKQLKAVEARKPDISTQ